MSPLNPKELALVNESSQEAKNNRHAEKVEIWRDGKLVDVKVLKIYDREKVKSTND